MIVQYNLRQTCTNKGTYKKKEKKDKLKSWVTKRIKKYMSVRDKIYKQIIMEKDQLKKQKKTKNFKNIKIK